MDGLAMADVLIVCLVSLLAIGVVVWIVKFMMRPAVFMLVFAALGWVLYLNLAGAL